MSDIFKDEELDHEEGTTDEGAAELDEALAQELTGAAVGEEIDAEFDPEVRGTMVREIEFQCKYTFNQEERLDLAEEMARAQKDVEREKDELKTVQAQYKSRITAAEGIRSYKAQLLSAGYEMRPMPCKEEKDFELGRVIITRLDTGEIVQDRVMTKGEQGEMF